MLCQVGCQSLPFLPSVIPDVEDRLMGKFGRVYLDPLRSERTVYATQEVPELVRFLRFQKARAKVRLFHASSLEVDPEAIPSHPWNSIP